MHSDDGKQVQQIRPITLHQRRRFAVPRWDISLVEAEMGDRLALKEATATGDA